MIAVSADWIVTLCSEPLPKGAVVCSDDGQIIEVLPSVPKDIKTEYYEGVICPGFINSHCHLELSHLAGKTNSGTGMIGFIEQIRQFREADDTVIFDALTQAERQMFQNGIVAVGDISNTAHSFEIKQKGTLRYHTFVEVFGFNPDLADAVFERAMQLYRQSPVRASIVPHAPYSVSAELFQKIALEYPFYLSMHNQESEAENLFFRDKEGDFTDFYHSLGIDISRFKPFGKSSLQAVLPYLKAKKQMLVHNTFTSAEDVSVYLTDNEDTYWCLCPLANRFIEGVLPNIPMLMQKGGKIILGTDSLASNKGLSILEEMKCIAEAYTDIDLTTMLQWACKSAAEYFDWQDLGTLEKGKRPGINLLSNVEVSENGNKMRLMKNSFVHRII